MDGTRIIQIPTAGYDEILRMMHASIDTLVYNDAPHCLEEAIRMSIKSSLEVAIELYFNHRNKIYEEFSDTFTSKSILDVVDDIISDKDISSIALNANNTLRDYINLPFDLATVDMFEHGVRLEHDTSGGTKQSLILTDDYIKKVRSSIATCIYETIPRGDDWLDFIEEVANVCGDKRLNIDNEKLYNSETCYDVTFTWNGFITLTEA